MRAGGKGIGTNLKALPVAKAGTARTTNNDSVGL